VGLILDTSTLVTAERRGHSVSEILQQVHDAWGETEVGLSAVTIVELSHGIQRAKHEAQRGRRQAFVHELRAALLLHPLTGEIAERAGLISGQEPNAALLSPSRIY
jgi:predicted nucleic acid-binding protein